MTSPEETGSRVTRWRGLIGLTGRRLLSRADGALDRVTLTAIVVAIAVALLLIVTGISAGLASESIVYSNDVDYWIIPESSTTLTTVVSVQGPQLGSVHQTNEQIEAIDSVKASSPVLVDIVRLRAPGSDEPEYVLGIGVIPGRDETRIAGLSTGPLEPGDPHYGTGEYDGRTTGEVVLSPAAADLLNASAGEELAVGSPATGTVEYSDFSVTAVSETEAQALGGNLPVAVFHLSELQGLTGAASGDQADQFLVQTNSPGVKSELRRVYPEATVVARGSISPEQVLDSDLPLAISVTSLLVAVVVATLFVATTMGLQVESDRQFLAVLEAIGITQNGRLLVVATTTIGLAVVGGLLGIVFAVVGGTLLNLIVTAQFGVPEVVQFDSLLIIYGIGVAVLVGILALPYPLLVARKTATSEVLRR